ncbi:SDR family NAD(P)-dependent oxidoreductase [Phenylobacterium deserti]|uniref:C-factor n=1 Tax=Phenylobacterium deserti TaxID=1914756 RepID=A0A328ABS3_9CAUL|nr:SDR family NAD(P)-dependent oxidoreductase [Phenylobacterium deserti]RAK52049.1 C-factor [Phenylobacterium deserti]
MAADVAVIVGASGGVGAALLAASLADERFDRVAALSRRPPAGLSGDSRLTWIAADIADEVSLSAAAEQLRAAGDLTRVIVATGLLHQDGLTPEKSLKALTPEGLEALFRINAIGPALCAKHLLPLTPRDRPSVFAVLSARVGSIGDNRLGGWYGYRASKAALNMLIRTAAIEHARTHPQAAVVALHPGTVRTGLSAPFVSRQADERIFTPETAAAHLLAVLDRIGPADSGGFFAWDGQPIAW